LITLVSSNLAEVAEGRMVSGDLTLVVDAGYEFCDLELVLEPRHRLQRPLLPEQPIKVQGPLETAVEVPGQTQWFLDRTSGYLSIGFTDAKSEDWYELGSGMLTIGTRGKGILSALVFQSIVEDTAGELEAAWLDEVEALAPRSAS